MWRLIGRNRRRYGGYVIHLGVVLMAIGIIGIELFQTETQGTIAQGEQLALGDYSLRFDELAVFDTPDGRNVARAVVSVYKDGSYVGELYPRRDFYFESQQQMTIPGVRSTWEDDLLRPAGGLAARFYRRRDLQDLSQPAGELAVVGRSGIYPGHHDRCLAG